MASGATGLVHYALTGTTPIGILLGGRWGEDISVQERGGIGGAGTNVPGAQFSAIQVQYLPVDSSCLIDKILRASYPNGAMTAINLVAGDDEVGISSAAWQAHQASIKMEANAALEMNLTAYLLSGKPTRTAGGGDHSTCAKTTFEWYRGSAKVGGVNAGLRSVEFQISNSLVPFWSLNYVNTGSERFPEYGVKGNESTRIAAVYLVDHAENLTNDEMQTIGTLIATVVNNAGSPKTITVTATTPQMHSWETGPTAHDQLKAINASLGMDINTGMALAIA